MGVATRSHADAHPGRIGAPAPLVLHLHGEDVFFDLVNNYPVTAVSWHDRETWPSLREALVQTNKTLMAGLDRNLLATGPPQDIAEQVRDAQRQTGGKGLILAPACVIPPDTPEEHWQAVASVLNYETHS